MSYYADLWSSDVVGWMGPLLDNGTYKARLTDGKFIQGELSDPPEPPWHYIEFIEGANCMYLRTHLFDVISPRTPVGKFIPRRCHRCWKIVARPKTLKQLFAFEELLTNLRWPGKCGIERRSYTPLSRYRYGGYVYNTSIAEGGERLLALRGKLKDHPELKDVECYLKRSCTEMEMEFPDSTKWEITDEQHRIENLLDWYIINDVPTTKTAKHILNRIHIKWIEWAAENGDETYLEYTGGIPLHRPCVRYERKVEGANEVTPDDKTGVDGRSSTTAPKGTTKRKPRRKK